MSLPFFREFGWQPSVLAVEPARQEEPREQALLASVPPDVPIAYVNALSTRWTRKVGVGNLALRALPWLYGAGARLLRARRHDLVYFSTTMFPAMTLGRVWKRRFAVPYVVDMQDPWLSTYYEEHPIARRPPKYRVAHALDRVLEPWTMKDVDGIVAVSQAYIDTLRSRYPRIDPECCATLPFGASQQDFALLNSVPANNAVYSPGDGCLHGVYVGRGGDDMRTALEIVFRALGEGRCERRGLFGRVRLHFVGTDYAVGARARRTVMPVAERAGVADVVTEQTARVGYFDGLRLLHDADFLVVVGSDDPQYSASKIYPYVLAKRPIIAVLHQESGAVPILRRLGAAAVVTFGDGQLVSTAASLARTEWGRMLDRLPYVPDTHWSEFEPFTAREMTRRQCELFDTVIRRRN